MMAYNLKDNTLCLWHKCEHYLIEDMVCVRPEDFCKHEPVDEEEKNNGSR